MCAARAGQKGKRVLVLERAEKPGKKILISGGGRCNFTNLGAGPANYLSANRHFAKSALARYTARDFLDLVKAYSIAWHEKTLGQLFCDGSAKQIVDMLLEECAKGDVELALGQAPQDVSHSDGAFSLRVGDRKLSAPALVIATGGPSIPKMGATGFAYDLARRFGLKIVEPRPALVPLTLGGEDVLFRALSGVAAPVEARANKASFREAALFTHRGLSGPAILQVSSYWRPGDSVTIDFLPDHLPDWLITAKRETPRATAKGVLGSVLPGRLAETLAERLDLPGELANLPDRKLESAARQLAAWTFVPNGSEGFAKAEVTAGGISHAVVAPIMATMRNSQKPWQAVTDPAHTVTAGGAGLRSNPITSREISGRFRMSPGPVANTNAVCSRLSMQAG